MFSDNRPEYSIQLFFTTLKVLMAIEYNIHEHCTVDKVNFLLFC